MFKKCYLLCNYFLKLSKYFLLTVSMVKIIMLLYNVLGLQSLAIVFKQSFVICSGIFSFVLFNFMYSINNKILCSINADRKLKIIKRVVRKILPSQMFYVNYLYYIVINKNAKWLYIFLILNFMNFWNYEFYTLSLLVASMVWIRKL